MENLELAQSILNNNRASNFAIQFASDIGAKLNKGWTLSDKQQALLNKLHSELEALNKPATGMHVGNPGQKLTLQVNVKAIRTFESAYGQGKAIEFNDQAGNVFVWLTSTPFKQSQGDSLTIQGTVKDHSEFRNVNQTVLTRVKVIA